jgi:hypothetical protein
VHLTQSPERTGIENNWFAIPGRVVAVKVETDGDLHIALQDAMGDKTGIVVCEIPAKPIWCEHYTRSHGALIRVYDEAGNVIDTHEHKGDLNGA